MNPQRLSPGVRYAVPVPNVRSYGIDEYLSSQDMLTNDANDSQASYVSIVPESRPGHFPDITNFAVCGQPGTIVADTELEEAVNAGLEPGFIVRIHDDNQFSRLHNRIMLVIRTNRTASSLSMTCLSFCRHNRGQTSGGFLHEHVPVRCGRRDNLPQAANNNLGSLRAVIGTDELPYRLKPNVWINVREVWNVDFGLRVLWLGRAEPESFVALLRKVKDVFCSTLGDADRAVTASAHGSNRTLHGNSPGSNLVNRSGGGNPEPRRRSFTRYQRSGLSGLIRQDVTVVQTPMERQRSLPTTMTGLR